MRFVIILIAAMWGIGAVLAFIGTREKTLDAKMTAVFIVLWPALAVTLLLNEPVSMLIAVPTMFAFIPWLMAGPHLWKVVQDPSCTRPDEIMGVPRPYWTWGGLGAIVLGILFS